MLPNFLYIGTGKAGSTWLMEALTWHPGVFVTPAKETDFFDLNFHRGTAWYEEFFFGAQAPAVGEIAHRYLRHPEAAERMRAVLGPTRCITVFREPEDYTMSSYLFAVRNGRFSGGPDAWVEQRFESDSVRYMTLLDPFIRAMGPENVFVGCFDDLQEDPAGFFRDICLFLGIEALGLPAHLLGKSNAAARPRSPALALLVNRTAKFLKTHGGQYLIAAVKRRKFVKSLLYAPLARDERTPFSPASRAMIRGIAEPEVRSLDRAMGTRLAERWYGAPGRVAA